MSQQLINNLLSFIGIKNSNQTSGKSRLSISATDGFRKVLFQKVSPESTSVSKEQGVVRSKRLKGGLSVTITTDENTFRHSQKSKSISTSSQPTVHPTNGKETKSKALNQPTNHPTKLSSSKQVLEEEPLLEKRKVSPENSLVTTTPETSTKEKKNFFGKVVSFLNGENKSINADTPLEESDLKSPFKDVVQRSNNLNDKGEISTKSPSSTLEKNSSAAETVEKANAFTQKVPLRTSQDVAKEKTLQNSDKPTNPSTLDGLDFISTSSDAKNVNLKGEKGQEVLSSQTSSPTSTTENSLNSKATPSATSQPTVEKQTLGVSAAKTNEQAQKSPEASSTSDTANKVVQEKRAVVSSNGIVTASSDKTPLSADKSVPADVASSVSDSKEVATEPAKGNQTQANTSAQTAATTSTNENNSNSKATPSTTSQPISEKQTLGVNAAKTVEHAQKSPEAINTSKASNQVAHDVTPVISSNDKVTASSDKSAAADIVSSTSNTKKVATEHAKGNQAQANTSTQTAATTSTIENNSNSNATPSATSQPTGEKQTLGVSAAKTTEQAQKSPETSSTSDTANKVVQEERPVVSTNGKVTATSDKTPLSDVASSLSNKKEAATESVKGNQAQAQANTSDQTAATTSTTEINTNSKVTPSATSQPTGEKQTLGVSAAKTNEQAQKAPSTSNAANKVVQEETPVVSSNGKVTDNSDKTPLSADKSTPADLAPSISDSKKVATEPAKGNQVQANTSAQTAATTSTPESNSNSKATSSATSQPTGEKQTLGVSAAKTTEQAQKSPETSSTSDTANKVVQEERPVVSSNGKVTASSDKTPLSADKSVPADVAPSLSNTKEVATESVKGNQNQVQANTFAQTAATTSTPESNSNSKATSSATSQPTGEKQTLGVSAAKTAEQAQKAPSTSNAANEVVQDETPVLSSNGKVTDSSDKTPLSTDKSTPADLAPSISDSKKVATEPAKGNQAQANTSDQTVATTSTTENNSNSKTTPSETSQPISEKQTLGVNAAKTAEQAQKTPEATSTSDTTNKVFQEERPVVSSNEKVTSSSEKAPLSADKSAANVAPSVSNSKEVATEPAKGNQVQTDTTSQAAAKTSTPENNSNSKVTPSTSTQSTGEKQTVGVDAPKTVEKTPVANQISDVVEEMSQENVSLPTNTEEEITPKENGSIKTSPSTQPVSESDIEKLSQDSPSEKSINEVASISTSSTTEEVSKDKRSSIEATQTPLPSSTIPNGVVINEIASSLTENNATTSLRSSEAKIIPNSIHSPEDSISQPQVEKSATNASSKAEVLSQNKPLSNEELPGIRKNLYYGKSVQANSSTQAKAETNPPILNSTTGASAQDTVKAQQLTASVNSEIQRELSKPATDRPIFHHIVSNEKGEDKKKSPAFSSSLLSNSKGEGKALLGSSSEKVLFQQVVGTTSSDPSLNESAIFGNEGEMTSEEIVDKSKMSRLESAMQVTDMRKEIPKKLAIMIKESPVFQEKGQQQFWHKHRFVLDNGKALSMAVRKSADGSIQLQINGGSPELTKIIQQFQEEIKQNLQEVHQLKVDIQFGNESSQQNSSGNESQSGQNSVSLGSLTGLKETFEGQEEPMNATNTNGWTG